MRKKAIPRIDVPMEELERVLVRARKELLDEEGYVMLKASLETSAIWSSWWRTRTLRFIDCGRCCSARARRRPARCCRPMVPRGKQKIQPLTRRCQHVHVYGGKLSYATGSRIGSPASTFMS
jgi:hypothetical protein